jgi:hypothetical protein
VISFLRRRRTDAMMLTQVCICFCYKENWPELTLLYSSVYSVATKNVVGPIKTLRYEVCGINAQSTGLIFQTWRMTTYLMTSCAPRRFTSDTVSMRGTPGGTNAGQGCPTCLNANSETVEGFVHALCNCFTRTFFSL